MTPERWKQIDELVQAALERPVRDRVVFLDQVCAGDAELRGEVESLIRYQEQAGSFLQSTALIDAATLLVTPDQMYRQGQVIGHYKLLNKIATGGMGEVYLAEDPTLERKVAVKFLLPDAAMDQTARKRFIREAQIAAKLDHPNICAIYETGEENEQCYLVMQYIEGETLDKRLKRQPLVLSEALEIAVQVAEALSEAHGRGIIHRDLKPQNIMLTPRGQVKVLDFGLAKVVPQGQAIDSAAQTESQLSGPGLIAGTLPYMSPEQVRGEALDARSDIFSFGVVLYEMVSGQQPFKADSSAETIAAILDKQPPPLLHFASAVPGELEQIVAQALEKDREERYQVVKDMRLDLKRFKRRLETAPSLPAVKADVARQLPHSNARLWAIIAALLLLALLVSLPFAIAYLRRAPAEVRALRLNLLLPEKATLRAMALAPDGSRLAFTAADAAGKALLYVRPLGSPTAQPLPGTDGAFDLFWSPDSRWIGFFDPGQGKLKKIDASGGPPQALCDAPYVRGGTWNRDGVIVFAINWGGLYRVSAAGGQASPLTTLDPARQEVAHRYPQFLPDGHSFLYFTQSGNPETRGIYVGSLIGKETKRVLGTDSSAVYAPPGYLLFRREATLVAQAFDAQKLALTGEPLPIAEQVGANREFHTYLTVSDNGVLAYHGAGPRKAQLVWFDRRGKQMEVIGAPGDYLVPALSPDGKRVAFESAVADPQTANLDIWLLEFARGTTSRFTFDPTIDGSPVWSPDGSRIVFCSNRSGIFDLYQKAASGAGSDELLLKSSNPKWPSHWSPDGRFILYESHDPKTKLDLWALPLEKERQPFPLLQTAFDEWEARFSPNGKWIAYTSNELGATQVYVRSFPDTGANYQVSTGGGEWPRWRRDGRELFYQAADGKLMSVEVKTEGVFEVGVTKPLFEIPRAAVAAYFFAVTDDGQRFLVRSPVEQTASAPITVVVNWAAEVKR